MTAQIGSPSSPVPFFVRLMAKFGKVFILLASITGFAQDNSIPITLVRAKAPEVSITLCVPGQPKQCQKIDHISLDTGSVGLRLSKFTLLSTANRRRSAPGPLVAF
jgi:hypothetical protein